MNCHVAFFFLFSSCRRKFSSHIYL